MTRFDPPGFLDDFTEEQKAQWSATVESWIENAKTGKPSENDGPRRQFFNPLTHPPAPDAQVAVISWNAFPRQIRMTSLSDRQRWRRADASRNAQDEYCEWSVTRDSADKIVRVTFTCEGPEYWEELARVNRRKVLDLYQDHVSRNITEADLFPGGTYDPLNRFNNSTRHGAMHLVQPNNTLQAEIELAGAATIRRVRDGAELTDAQELIECSQYGAAGRNSDPHIGEQVNALARQRADITVNNPTGLYLHEFNPIGWTTPDAADPREFMKFTRGKEGHFVRAVFEVPASRGYHVSDIKIAGRPIEFGSQIVDFLTIKLEGLATRIGQSTVQPFSGCRGEIVPASLAVASTTAAVRAAGRVPVPRPQPIDEKALIARLPARLRRTPDDEPQLTVAALLSYPHLPAEQLAPRTVTGRLLAYASPDSTFAVTKRLIDSARESLVIGIYDFSATHVLAILKRAMSRGVSLTLMLDTNSGGEDNVLNELRQLGATCVESPSSSAGSPRPFFQNAHEKIIVVDGQIVMIQSGNWSGNSIPFNEGDGEVSNGSFQAGNRDMGVAIHSRELAGFFAGLIERDIRLAQGQDNPGLIQPAAVAAATAGATAAEIFFEAASTEQPPTLFKSLDLQPCAPFQVTPVLSPENYADAALVLLRSARRSVYLEQQYIRGTQSEIAKLLAAIGAAREDSPALEVRIIVSEKFLSSSDRAKFEGSMEEHGFEPGANYRYLSLQHFVHCHNKLIVVDGEKVLVGSQNWSTTAIRQNREASLLIENPAVAGYLAGIFEADWNLSAPDDLEPASVFAAQVEGLREAADFARGGVVASTVRDYRDV